MADERTTSFAKSVEGLVQPENTLDRARKVRDEFLCAHNDNHKPMERETSQTSAGSQMVKDDQPVLRPTPSGPMRQPDRVAAYGKLSNERAEASKNLLAARKAHEAFKARLGPSKPHEQERDRDRDR